MSLWGVCIDNNTGGFDCGCTELFYGGVCGDRVDNPIVTPPTASVVLKNATNITLAEDIQIEVFHGGTHNLPNGTYTPNILNFTITGGTVTLGAARITFRGNGNSSVSFTATGSTEALNTALDAATYTRDTKFIRNRCCSYFIYLLLW